MPAASAVIETRQTQVPELPSAESPVEEKRRHPRYRCEGMAEVFLPHGGLLLRGRILNLSVSGCYIETAMLNLERGTLVEVYFVTNRLQFRVQGNIAEVRGKRGAGISFVNVSPRRAVQIARLVRELAEQQSTN
ncbi:MAG TPA: PilZ domain-containing protein [Silvibacterium sp.]|nr:PilZ domain-containing protein [Silvibacterium sp.]